MPVFTALDILDAMRVYAVSDARRDSSQENRRASGLPAAWKGRSKAMELDSSSMERLREVLLELLQVVDKFCEEHHLTYFLDGGTAIGAARHAGFIPWDDDADIGMLRADYERFLIEAEHGLPEGYSLRTYDNTPGYAPLFAKVMKDGTVFDTEETVSAGISQPIFVDIFPFDDLSSDPRERRRQIRQASRWSKLSYLYHAPYVNLPWNGLLGACGHVACRVVHRFLQAFYSREQIQERFNASLRFSGKPSGEVTTLVYTGYGEMPRSIILPVKRMPFEGVMLCCPGDIASYLTLGYGADWTELPPVEQRKTHAPVALDFGDGS